MSINKYLIFMDTRFAILIDINRVPFFRMSKVDQPFLFITAVLVLTGIFILSSASVVISQKNYGITYAYTVRHLIYVLAGIIAAFTAQAVPFGFWKKIAFPLLFFSVFLLVLVFLPKIGFEHGGAKRWINLSFLTIQPAEILKFSLAVYLAGWLSSRKGEEKSLPKAFIPFVIIISIVSILLILQPDIGTLGVVVITSCFLYFIGGGKISQLMALAGLGLIVLYFIIQAAPYRMERLEIFLNPSRDTKGAGYQITQSFIALGSGGVWGRGLGKGIQKYNYLPEPIGDSIFAVFGEETGFAGILIFISLLLLFLWRGIYISRKSPDFFGMLLGFGLTVGIMTQAIINIGAISGLLPLTGIPLPFISYGGTAMVVNLVSAGVLLNISKHI